MDRNTGFEFNLNLLKSETGYRTSANGKEFLVRLSLLLTCCAGLLVQNKLISFFFLPDTRLTSAQMHHSVELVTQAASLRTGVR